MSCIPTACKILNYYFYRRFAPIGANLFKSHCYWGLCLIWQYTETRCYLQKCSDRSLMSVEKKLLVRIRAVGTKPK